MRVRFTCAILLTLLLAQNYLSAQEKLNLKFGKISAADFDLSRHSFDTSTGAVYIADYGVTEFDGGIKGTLTLNFTRHLRLKILNHKGFDAATFEIALYRSGDAEEKLQNFNAATYNLENGKVVTTKLADNSIFKEKETTHWITRKFTMPSVMEGSIIELTYSIRSDFTENLQPWIFQGAHPRLWSEYNVSVPDFMEYLFITQGFNPFYIKSQENKFKSFGVISHTTARGQWETVVNTTVTKSRFVMKDVPPLKEEGYVTTLDNYISKISFQLSKMKVPNGPLKTMSSWNKVSEELLQAEYFGAGLEAQNSWMDEELKPLTDAADLLKKAKKIYAYVRDNFTCTTWGMYVQGSLKEVFQSKKGNAAEINMLLIALLRHAGVTADPIVLSTRDNGYSHPFYPFMNRFNYVIAALKINDAEYFLDATEHKLGFGFLPLRCYNGHARFINATAPDPVFFVADSVNEAKVTTISIDKNIASLNSKLGYYESLSLRSKLAEKGKEQVLNDIKSQYPAETTISGLEIDGVNDLDRSLHVRYNVSVNFNDNIVYFNPMLAEGYKENYFKSAERLYPVEMPFVFDEVYTLDMEIPDGYVVDELPRPVSEKLNDHDGLFEYQAAKNGNRLTVRSRVKIGKAYFQPADYKTLRSFFAQVVAKHAEMVVFRKK